MLRRMILMCMSVAAFVMNGVGQNNYYTITIRTQFSDSSQYCSCPQNYNPDEYSSSGICNTLDNVTVSLYNDTNLLSTTSTDNTGYISIKAYSGTYKLVFVKQNFETLTVKADLSAIADPRHTFSLQTAGSLHFVDNGSSTYFLCVIMQRKINKSGIRIIPK